MISKNVPHTYISEGTRYFAFLHPVVYDENNIKLKAYTFHIFDEEGFCWFQITHGTMAFIKSISPYMFESRTILEVDEQPWNRKPIINHDHEMVSGSAEMGYMLEGLKEGLGLDLILFKDLLGEIEQGENQ